MRRRTAALLFLFLGLAGLVRAQEEQAQSAFAHSSNQASAEPLEGGRSGQLHLPTPLLGEEGAISEASAGEVALDLVAAQRALRLGFPSTAAVLYRDLLQSSTVLYGARLDGSALQNAAGVTLDANAAFQTMLRLGLVTALMDDGRFAEAVAVLEEVPEGERGAEWRLRAGLLAAARRDFAEARRLAGSFKPEELPSEERACVGRCSRIGGCRAFVF